MMKYVIGLMLVLASSQAVAKDACSDRGSDDHTAVTSALISMYQQEQEEAASSDPDKAKSDDDRAKEARKLDDKGWLCSPHDKFYAAWIMRQTDDPEQLARAYELAAASMESRVPRSKWLTAYLFDRWHVYLGRDQRYGALTAVHKNHLCLFIVDAAVGDDERAQYDMPPIAAQYERVMSDNGLKGPFTWDEMQRKGLWCPAKGSKKNK
ncbi:MAG: hypothetical protein ACI8PZ_006244 [Myxococcota bacterium]|jgi:hypothetical protein